MEFVLYEKKGSVAWVTINRPEAMNSLSSGVIAELLQSFDMAHNDMEVLCVVLTGAGEKAFCAGGDIKEERELKSKEAAEFCKLGHDVCRKIQKLRVPVIAAVNGYALGGGLEFAMACDIIMAVETAKFGLPSVKLGIISGFGGTQLITRIVGKARAKELMFTGRMFNAKEAFELGIVQRVSEKDKFINEVTALSEEIASMPPYAVRTIKEVVEVGVEMDIVSAFAVEEKYAAPCYDTEDKYEAMTAFIEKRKPNKFVNR